MKKHLLILFALITSLFLMAAVSCSATTKVTDLTVDDGKVVKEVKVGDDVDVSKLTAIASFEDGTTKSLTANDVAFYIGNSFDAKEIKKQTKLEGTVFKGLTEKVGQVKILVEYMTLVRTITITVDDLVAVNLEVDASLIPEVKVGDDADFSSVTATVTFDNESTKALGVTDLEFYSVSPSYSSAENKKLEPDEDNMVSGISTAEGEVTIYAVYREATAEFKVTVIPLTINDMYEFQSLALPSSENARVTQAKSFLADSDAKARLVGSANPFRFLPVLSVHDYTTGKGTNLTEYDTASVIKDGDGVELREEDDADEKIAKYYFNDELIVTAYYGEGKYQFTHNAEGKVYSITVLPRELECEEEDAVKVTVEIVDGFNVYDAKDLAIIDNTTEKSWSVGDSWAKTPDVWAGIRQEKGFTVEMSNSTKAIVLQMNIDITPADLPDAYVGTVERDLDYYAFGQDNDNDGKYDFVKTVKNAKRLTHDSNGNLFIYERVSDSSFTVYGNHYNLNAAEVPLVSAFKEKAVEKDQLGKSLEISDYGSDTSNAALFRFCGTKEDETERAVYSFKDLNVIGNANTEQWVIYGPNDANRTQDPLAVNAGGFIFAKAKNCNISSTNVMMNRCFIGYLLEDYVKATADYIKVTDSYQDAAFIWGDSEMDVKRSVLKNAGGPLFIMQHVEPKTNTDSRIPKLTVADCDMENFITGDEMWFADRGASALIPGLKTGINGFLNGISAAISQASGQEMPTKTATKKSGNKDNCLNLIVLMMSNGSGAAALGTTETQGYCEITQNGKTYVADRTSNSQLRAGNNVLSLGAATFNVDVSTGFFYTPDATSIAYAGANQNLAAAAVYQGDYIVFNQTGMGLVLGTSFM